MDRLLIKRAFRFPKAFAMLTAAVLCICVLAYWGTHNKAHAQTTLYYVVINASTTPPTIGVAPSNWSGAGWLKQAGPYYSSAAAWANACGMHLTRKIHEEAVRVA